MMSQNTLQWLFIGALVAIAGSLGYVTYYGHGQLVALNSQLATLQGELATTSEILKAEIESTGSSLASALNETKQSTESRFGSVEQTVGSISGQVGTLEKLSKTDPELLQKYSKVFFLNEHYVPERVSNIPLAYLYNEASPEVVHAGVWPKLESLIRAASNAGVPLYVASAYRSFDEQHALKGLYTVTYGAGTANQFSADQGYSEHQLGTTVDFITSGLGGRLEGFEGTPAYSWLLANAHRWGFTLSYPENNSYYIFEPWHWRYVGVGLATYLKNTGQHFYDLDQRKIDEYLVNIFD